ncbi:hypothetical protein [Wukongibacter sp. M2B1]
MDKEINDFLKCCFNLGKELTDRENLTEVEKKFLIGLDKIGEIIEKNV